MIEAFPELADLDDDFELVILQALQDPLIGGRLLAAMDIVRLKSALAIRTHDVDAVLIVQCGGDDLEPTLTGHLL